MTRDSQPCTAIRRCALWNGGRAHGAGNGGRHIGHNSRFDRHQHAYAGFTVRLRSWRACSTQLRCLVRPVRDELETMDLARTRGLHCGRLRHAQWPMVLRRPVGACIHAGVDCMRVEYHPPLVYEPGSGACRTRVNECQLSPARSATPQHARRTSSHACASGLRECAQRFR
jgi:hypothetical protein